MVVVVDVVDVVVGVVVVVGEVVVVVDSVVEDGASSAGSSTPLASGLPDVQAVAKIASRRNKETLSVQFFDRLPLCGFNAIEHNARPQIRTNDSYQLARRRYIQHGENRSQEEPQRQSSKADQDQKGESCSDSPGRARQPS